MRFTILLLFCAALSIARAQSSEAVIEQIGNRNAATVEQTASLAFLTQVGDANQAVIEQAGGGHVTRLEQSGGAIADIFQAGSGNVLAGLDGFGFGDASLTALSLGGSELYLFQSGTGNASFVQQDAGAYAQITQVGADNAVTVIQRGG